MGSISPRPDILVLEGVSHDFKASLTDDSTVELDTKKDVVFALDREPQPLL